MPPGMSMNASNLKFLPEDWQVDLSERYYSSIGASRLDAVHTFYALSGEGLLLSTALKIGMKGVFENTNISNLVARTFLMALPPDNFK